MPKLDDLGEKEIVARLIEIFDSRGAHDLGDDCAVLDMGREFLLLTTDMINEKTHIPDGAGARDVGWHIAAINLSDIAAMGGQPLGMLFALGMPSGLDFAELEEMASGIQECCSSYGVPVLGGDTKENENYTISGTAVGSVMKSEILRRKGARPGDIVAMTGALGKPMAWYRNKSPENVQFLLRVVPRVRESQILARSTAVTSCIDTSDGLGTSLHHLSRASGLGFEIHFEKLPFATGLSPEEKELVLHYGGDYELLFTVAPERADRVFNADFGGAPITQIGVVSDDAGVFLNRDGASQPLEDRGYEHFGGGE